MGDDRIKGQDLYGDTWRAQVRPGNRIEIEATENGHVAGAMLSPTDAARLSSFLLSAAGVDLVCAARKVVEVMSDPNVGRLHRDSVIDALAAELAKFDTVRT